MLSFRDGLVWTVGLTVVHVFKFQRRTVDGAKFPKCLAIYLFSLLLVFVSFERRNSSIG